MEMIADIRLKLLEEQRQKQLGVIQRYESLPEASVYKRNKKEFGKFMGAMYADLRVIEHMIKISSPEGAKAWSN